MVNIFDRVQNFLVHYCRSRVRFRMGFFRDWDFLFRARSKNSENLETSGIRIGILKSRKNPDWKIPKSRGSGSEFEKLEKIQKIQKKSRENLSFLSSGYPGDFFIPGIGIFSVGWDIPPKSQLWLENMPYRP